MGLSEYINLNSTIRALQSLNKFRNTPQVNKPIWCQVEGSIPPWINGTLYCVGPSKYNLGEDEQQFVIKHAFDGLPYVHRFELSSEKQAVRYNNRNIAENVERRLVKNPNDNQVYFGYVPEVSTWQNFINMTGRLSGTMGSSVDKTTMDPSDEMVGVTVTPNFPMPRNVKATDDQVLVTKTDANFLQQIHSTTLEPKLLFDYGTYDKRLNGEVSAAHHQRDPSTGESFNFSLKFGRKPVMTVFSVDSKGDATVYANISERVLPNGKRTTFLPAYIHSFWLTENYIVIPESPLHYANFGVDVLAHGVISTALAWKESSPAYLHIISRDPKRGHVVSLPVDPFFTFHTGNAWDTLDSNGNPVLELDCCAMDNADFLYQLHRYGVMERYAGEQNRKATQAKQRGIKLSPGNVVFGDLHRYRATWNSKAKTGEATYTKIAKNLDFPRFAPHKATQPTRYLWACQHEDATAKHSERYSLVKVDTESGQILKFERQGHMFQEPVFLPNPNGTKEDDGALLSFANIIDERGQSYDRCILVIVNATTMEEIGRCDIGAFNATTFHGSYVDVDFVSVAVN